MESRTALVTGANRGLGKAITKKLVENQINVIACARKENIEFESFLNELSRGGVLVKPLYFDLSDEDEITSAMKEVRVMTPPVNILINNAGIGHMGLLQMTKTETINKIFKVNTIAPILLSRMLVPIMAKQHYGRIINISSTAAEEIYIGNSLYGASKAAISAFTKSIASEVFQYGITVNAIAPGLIDTDMSHIFEGKNPEEPLKHSALGRKIEPTEIANVILTLLAPSMDIVNGDVITVNGGHK